MLTIRKLVLIPLLASVSLTTLANNGITLTDENNTKVTLKGAFNFMYGHNYQKHLGKDNDLTLNQRRDAFNTDVNVKLDIERDTEQDFKYGAKIVLNTTTSMDGGASANGSHIWVLNDNYGKVELGSPFSAARKMHLTAAEVDQGTGGIGWTDFIQLKPNNANTDFRDSDKLYMDSLKGKNNEPSRKISYYTPEFAGLQAGVSYVPDTSNVGDNKFVDKSKADHFVSSKKRLMKNLLAYGVTFKHNIADGVDAKLAFTGEYAKKTGHETDSKTNVQERLGKVNAYNIGGHLAYGNFGIAASYGSLGKSLSTKMIEGEKRKSDFYTVGLGYTQGPVGVSLLHFNGNHHGNKLKSVSLATSYEFAKGLKGMAEVTQFSGKSKSIGTKDANRGVIGQYKPKGFTFITGLSIAI